MNGIAHNRILTKILIGFLLSSVFFAPVVSLTQKHGALEIAVTYAADATKGESTWEAVVGNTVLSVGAFFTYYGGMLLEFSLRELVFEMGDDIGKGALKGAIDSMWKVIRDISNLVFIFGFIYIGIRTIIDPDSASTKRFLAQIIIGALLINFSLFIAKFVIDISNFTAFQLYKSMVQGTGFISENFAQLMGISGLYKTDAQALVNLSNSGSFWFYFMGAIMLVVAAFVMAAGGILLIVRYVALILIMIFSPILFAATVFPQTAGYAKTLWSKLFSYSFFAPIYLLLLVVSIEVLRGVTNAMGVNKRLLSTGLQQGGDAFAVILNFVIVIMFLIFTLLVAQKMGVRGGDMAVSVGNNIRGRVQGVIGRNTGGRAGNWLAKKQDEMRKSDSKGRQFAASLIRGSGINAAAVAGKKAKFGSALSREDKVKENEEIDRARAKSAQVTRVSNAIDAAVVATPGVGGDSARIAMEESLADASTEQLLDLLKKNEEGTPERTMIVANITSNQFDGLMKAKSEDFDDAKKEKLRAERATAVEGRLINVAYAKKLAATPAGTAPPAALTLGDKDVISKADAKDLDALDFDTMVLPNAGLLSSKQIDDMSLTPTAKARVKDKRTTELVKELKPAGLSTPGSATALFGRITNDTERAKLPREILTDKHVARILTANVLNKILETDNLSQADRTIIKTEITTFTRVLDPFFTSPRGSQF
jgi:hypothetical protein